MSSKHVISNMNPGDTKWISNDQGEYILTRVPMEDDETLYEYPNIEVVLNSVKERLENKYQEILDTENDKNNDHANDNKV